MEKEILGTNYIPSNMKAGCGRAGFSISPGFCCNHPARQDTLIQVLSSTNFPPSVHKRARLAGLGGSPGLLSRGENLQSSHGRQGEEAGLYISTESFNVDVRENLLTARQVRHEKRLSGVAVKCLRPCEDNVSQRWLERVDLPCGKSEHGSFLTVLPCPTFTVFYS